MEIGLCEMAYKRYYAFIPDCVALVGGSGLAGMRSISQRRLLETVFGSGQRRGASRKWISESEATEARVV